MSRPQAAQALATGRLGADWRVIESPATAGPAQAADGPHDVTLWLSAYGAHYPELDRRGQAAFAMGRFAFDLGRHLALAALRLGRIPFWPAQTVRPVLESYRDAAYGEAELLRFRFEIAGRLDWAEAAPERLAETMEALAAPVVAALGAASRLSPGALWRLAADGLASGVLHTGCEDCRIEEALALGRAALASAPRLARLGADYRLVSVEADPASGAAGLERWFLRRSGCCRWYTSGEGREKCGSCVLLSEEQQVARLSSHLRDEARALAGRSA